MGEDKVSVIITAYNVENYISKAIESVLNSTYSNIECIVVEDCSTDNTLDIINKYNVKLVQHKQNLGAGKARQSGIDNSTGNWIMFLDADDWIELDAIEKLIQRAHETNADMCFYSRQIHIKDSIKNNILPNLVTSGIDKYARMLLMGNYLCDAIIKKSLFDKVKYCPRRYIEDTPTAYKLLYYANLVSFNDFIGGHYNVRENSLCTSASPVKTDIFTAIALVDIIMFFFKKDYDVIEKMNFIEMLEQEITLIHLNAELYPEELDKYKKEYNFILSLYKDIIEKIKNRKNKEKSN